MQCFENFWGANAPNAPPDCAPAVKHERIFWIFRKFAKKSFLENQKFAFSSKLSNVTVLFFNSSDRLLSFESDDVFTDSLAQSIHELPRIITSYLLRRALKCFFALDLLLLVKSRISKFSFVALVLVDSSFIGSFPVNYVVLKETKVD